MRLLLSLICLFSIGFAAYAGDGVWSKHFPLTNIGSGLTYSIADRSHAAEDVKELSSYTGFLYLDYTRKNHSDLTFNSEWRVTVGYEYVAGGATTTGELNIASSGRYLDYVKIPANIDLPLGYKVKITSVIAQYYNSGGWITESTLSGSTHIPSDIEFRMELHSTKQYALEYGGNDVSALDFDPSSYRASWNYLQGAELYDFEWVFIDKHSKEYTDLIAAFANPAVLNGGGYSLPFEMKEPARVRVWGTHYVLDKTYPEGTLYFRVRSVNSFVSGGMALDQVKNGAWSYFYTPSGGTVTLANLVKHEVTGSEVFESGKNWLYGIAYAEEGKSVSTVSFYDGSNRGRQSLAYNTSDQVTLISESKFDYEGRQTISVIPAPVKGRQLGYHSGFNRNMASGIFDAQDFDIQISDYNMPGSVLPEPLLSPASGESGAAQYFSPNNQFTDDLFRNAVPDAGGYVYNQTIYRNDGSGRIQRVGGIGAEFTASGNHAVQTFYGSPTKTELRRLFGNNVHALAEGYRKNMVRDANGQYSVSYFDKRGNTIATGLSGNSPDNLIALDDQEAVTVYTDLMQNNISVDPYTMISETTFLNGVENNPVTITYDLQGAINQISSAPVNVGYHIVTFGDLCSTCLYELTIEVKNAAGVIINPPVAVPVDAEHPHTVAIDPALLPCHLSGSSTGVSYVMPSVSVNMPHIGEYRIIKTLRVDVESMTAAFNQQLADFGYTSSSSFVEDYMQNVDISGCFEGCDDYCTALCRYEYNQSHGANAWNTLGLVDKQALIDACVADACNPDDFFEDPSEGEGWPEGMEVVDNCSSLRDQMIKQISPGGVLYDNHSSSFWSSIGGGSVTIGGESYTISQLQDPEIYTEDMALALLGHHREICHLQLCAAWSSSIDYSTRLNMEITNTPWNPSALLYSAPYSLTVGGVSGDPFALSVFNTVTPNLQYRVDNYLTAHPEPLFSSSTGNLAAYAEQYVAQIVATNLSETPPVVLTASEQAIMKSQIFKGIYDHIKETMVREYKESIGCNYLTDDNAIFKGMKTQQEMEDEISGVVSSIVNNPSCHERGLQNAANWISQLPAACIEAIEQDGMYYPTYTGADLYLAARPGNIEQLFYNYSIATCQSNTWGWFYNPGVGNPGMTDYTAVKAMLNTYCGSDEVSFEVDPAPDNISSTITNQQFPDCFLQLIELMNDGIAALNSAPVTCTEFGCTDCVQSSVPVNMSGNINYPELYTCGGYRAIFNTFICDGKLVFKSNTDGSCKFDAVFEFFPAINPQPGDIISISNPVKYASYVLNGSTYNNVVTFDVSLSNGETARMAAIFNSKQCFDVGSFATQTITNPSAGNQPTPSFEEDCIEAEEGQAGIDAEIIYGEIIRQVTNRFMESMSSCLTSVTEHFGMTYFLKEYQYTLYYYDLAGNLVQTVPPQGVDILSPAQVTANADPDHKMETRYSYNGLNFLTGQYTPDGGITNFLHDKLYRVRFSQNARQAGDGMASYSKYDALGRITEAGEMKLTGSFASLSAYVEDNAFPTTNRLDYTLTHYEEGYGADPAIETLFTGGEQRNLRNAIGAVEHHQGDYNNLGQPISGTEVVTVLSYSYDVHKNVKEMVSTNYQLLQLGQQHKKVQYEYDLLSGNVNEVTYQAGAADEFHHRYHYDANNRLVRAFTSNNGERWEMDAKYFYYLHGVLARTETGHDKVQGTDYAYNLQGWLKGINSTTLHSSRDLGKDGNAGLNQYTGIDVAGFNLGYFKGDYKPIANSDANYENNIQAFASTDALMTKNGTHGNLWNGNISHMVTALRNKQEEVIPILGNNYRYDQLQRIKAMDAYSADNLQASNNFAGADLYNKVGAEGAYQERYNFDKNGNLTYLKRNGSGRNFTGTDNTALQMDELIYHYYQGDGNDQPLHQNRLAYVEDLAVAGSYSTDISGQSVGNYEYDASGQLTSDHQENIYKIEWTATGKVKKIIFEEGQGKYDLKFIYDPMGRRIVKMQYLNAMHSDIKYTYYTYDASGNPMAVYNRTLKLHETEPQFLDKLELDGHNLYGSSRIGTHSPNLLIASADVAFPSGTDYNAEKADGFYWHNLETPVYDQTFREVGNKRYEFSNHLGNVLEVVTDRKRPITLEESSSKVDLANVTEGTLCSTVGSWVFQGSQHEQADFNGDGEIDMKISATAVQYGNGQLTVNTIPGEIYTVNYTVLSHNVNNVSSAARNCSPTTVLAFFNSNQAGTFSYTFTATGNTARISWNMDNTPANDYGEFILSNISVTGTGDPLGNLVTRLAYVADVVTYSDYSPYGTMLDQRHGGSGDGYRYGFQGQEKDDEVSEEGNSYTAEFWQYSPRIGRRWNIDPVVKFHESPYAAFANDPILFRDPNGADTFVVDFQGALLEKRLNNQGPHALLLQGDKKLASLTTNQNVSEGNTVDFERLRAANIGEYVIHFISDQNINHLMYGSMVGVEDSPNSFLWKHSGDGGNLDFGGMLFTQGGYADDPRYKPKSEEDLDKAGAFFYFGTPDELYIGAFADAALSEIIGKPLLFNLMDAGNLLWGQAAYRAGASFDDVQFGTNIRNLKYGNLYDSDADQQAIYYGFTKKMSTVNYAIHPTFSGLSLHINDEGFPVSRINEDGETEYYTEYRTFREFHKQIWPGKYISNWKKHEIGK